MKKQIIAFLLAVALFGSSVIGTYDRAEASSVVIGTVGVAEFILSLLASAGVTYITVDTLTQGWTSQNKKAYEELAAQLEQSYEGRRLEVIEGGGGEQPPQWDKFMDAAISAKTIEYTAGIWDCVRYAIKEIMKPSYDMQNDLGISYDDLSFNSMFDQSYLTGYLYFRLSGQEKGLLVARLYSGYLYLPEYPRLNAVQSYHRFVTSHSLLMSRCKTGTKTSIEHFYSKLNKSFSKICFSYYKSNSYSGYILYTTNVAMNEVSLYYFYSDSSNLGMSIHGASGGTFNGGAHTLAKYDSGKIDNVYDIYLPPYVEVELDGDMLGNGFYIEPVNSAKPGNLYVNHDNPMENLDTMPQPPDPVNFPTADQIQALIDALNQANNNHSEDEEQKKNEQSSAVDDFIGDLTKPEPGTNPDPGTDPEPDTKPDPGTDPEPDTKPDPGTNPDTPPDVELEMPDLQFDLKKIFPFCIPFDLFDLLSVLNAEPETPVLHLNIPSLNPDHTITANDLTIDLSPLDGLMEIFRLGELVAFVVGLMLVTGRLIKW